MNAVHMNEIRCRARSLGLDIAAEGIVREKRQNAAHTALVR